MNENNQSQTFEDLSEGFINYLNHLSYSDGRIKFYQRGIRLISEFMEKEGMNYYSSEICSKYVEFIIGLGSYDSLSRNKKDHVRVATSLLEYQITGAISYRSTRKSYKLSGEIGACINEFLFYRRSRNFSEDTIASNRLYLSRMHAYLESKGIKQFSELNQQEIMAFINSLGFYSKATIHCTLCSVRVFLSK